MWGCSPSKQSSCDGLVEEIDDGVRGSTRGAGREIERDRELAAWCSSGSSVGARRADWGAFYRRGEAVEEGARWPAGRRASRQPLMAFGLVGASRSGGAIRGSSTGDGTARQRLSGAPGIPRRVERVGTGVLQRVAQGSFVRV